MDTGFFEYLQQLELLSFFSGYPLLYVLVQFAAGKLPANRYSREKIPSLLPMTYAVTGLLFLGLVLKNLFPDYTVANISNNIYNPFLFTWGLSSLLFFLPQARKKTVFSFLHSLVFFFIIIRDMLQSATGNQSDSHILKNDMRIYTDSLLLHAAVFGSLLILFYFIRLAGVKKTV